MTRSAIPSSSASINDSDNTPGLSSVRMTASFVRSVTGNRSSPRRAGRQTCCPKKSLRASSYIMVIIHEIRTYRLLLPFGKAEPRTRVYVTNRVDHNFCSSADWLTRALSRLIFGTAMTSNRQIPYPQSQTTNRTARDGGPTVNANHPNISNSDVGSRAFGFVCCDCSEQCWRHLVDEQCFTRHDHRTLPIAVQDDRVLISD